MKGPRLDRVEIADFRGIPAAGFGPLVLGGQNLLLFGENGSGKSSIFHALADLLDLSPDARPFNAILADARCLKHRFSDPALTTGHVTLHFTPVTNGAAPAAPMQWPIGGVRPLGHPYFRSMARVRGCLDYRAMLRTSFVHEEADGVNLFPLLLGSLLRDIEERGLGQTFGDAWDEILKDAAALPGEPPPETDPPARDDFSHAAGEVEESETGEDWTEEKPPPRVEDPATVVANRQRAVLSKKIVAFNDAIERWRPELERKANEFLRGFKSGAAIELRYDVPLSAPQWSNDPWHESARLHLRATFRNELLHHPATFLNEARLSGIALAIYLAALHLATPTPESGVADFPRLLVMDDVLLGIDMANRVPVLDLIQKDFADWQVLLFTHDRVWYEIARQRLKKAWQHYDLFSVRIGNYEQPLLCEDHKHLARARTFLGLDEVPAGTVRPPCDVKAAAAHVRTQFELTLKRGCEELGVKIAFDSQPRKMAAKTFWDALKGHRLPFNPEPTEAMRNGKLVRVQPEPQKVPVVPPDLEQAIEHLDWVLNPLVHSESAPRFRQEVEDGIAAVETLEMQIDRALGRELETIAPKWELLLRLLDWLRRKLTQSTRKQ